jgi:hypothetical protein
MHPKEKGGKVRQVLQPRPGPLPRCLPRQPQPRQAPYAAPSPLQAPPPPPSLHPAHLGLATALASASLDSHCGMDVHAPAPSKRQPAETRGGQPGRMGLAGACAEAAGLWRGPARAGTPASPCRRPPAPRPTMVRAQQRAVLLHAALRQRGQPEAQSVRHGGTVGAERVAALHLAASPDAVPVHPYGCRLAGPLARGLPVGARVLKGAPGARAVSPQHQLLAQQREGVRLAGVQVVHREGGIPAWEGGQGEECSYAGEGWRPGVERWEAGRRDRRGWREGAATSADERRGPRHADEEDTDVEAHHCLVQTNCSAVVEVLGCVVGVWLAVSTDEGAGVKVVMVEAAVASARTRTAATPRRSERMIGCGRRWEALSPCGALPWACIFCVAGTSWAPGTLKLVSLMPRHRLTPHHTPCCASEARPDRSDLFLTQKRHSCTCFCCKWRCLTTWSLFALLRHVLLRHVSKTNSCECSEVTRANHASSTCKQQTKDCQLGHCACVSILRWTYIFQTVLQMVIVRNSICSSRAKGLRLPRRSGRGRPPLPCTRPAWRGRAPARRRASATPPRSS